MKTKKFFPIVIALILLIAVKVIAAEYSSSIIYNYTASVPIGFYGLDKTANTFTVGDLIIYKVPDNIKNLIAERKYIRPGDTLIKPIVAIAGDEVCFQEHHILINGKIMNQMLQQDTLGRPLPQLYGCQILQADEYLTLTKYPNSLDGRYHGVISKNNIVGKATPIFQFGS